MHTSLSYLPDTPETPRPWDIVADGYATGAMDFFRAYSEAALDFVPVEPGHHIADIACGPGTLSLIAARKGVSVSALDFSTNMLRHLESRITADGLNTISTHKGDGQDLPFDDATFDAAFSMFGLMFFPDRETGYKEMRRTVKPGGYACVSSWAPMSQSSLIFNLWQALLEIAPDLPDAMGAIPSLSDPEILEAEMVEAGFHEVEIRAVEHGATFPTAREFWAAMERGSEPIAVLKSKTTAEAWREKSRRAVRHLEENAGPFPRHLSAKAWIGIGRK